MNVSVELREGYTLEDIQDTGFVFGSTRDCKPLGITLHLGVIREEDVEALREHPAVLAVSDNERRNVTTPDGMMQ